MEGLEVMLPYFTRKLEIQKPDDKNNGRQRYSDSQVDFPILRGVKVEEVGRPNGLILNKSARCNQKNEVLVGSIVETVETIETTEDI